MAQPYDFPAGFRGTGPAFDDARILEPESTEDAGYGAPDLDMILAEALRQSASATPKAYQYGQIGIPDPFPAMKRSPPGIENRRQMDNFAFLAGNIAPGLAMELAGPRAVMGMNGVKAPEPGFRPPIDQATANFGIKRDLGPGDYLKSAGGNSYRGAPLRQPLPRGGAQAVPPPSEAALLQNQPLGPQFSEQSMGLGFGDVSPSMTPRAPGAQQSVLRAADMMSPPMGTDLSIPPVGRPPVNDLSMPGIGRPPVNDLSMPPMRAPETFEFRPPSQPTAFYRPPMVDQPQPNPLGPPGWMVGPPPAAPGLSMGSRAALGAAGGLAGLAAASGLTGGSSDAMTQSAPPPSSPGLEGPDRLWAKTPGDHWYDEIDNALATTAGRGVNSIKSALGFGGSSAAPQGQLGVPEGPLMSMMPQDPGPPMSVLGQGGQSLNQDTRPKRRRGIAGPDRIDQMLADGLQHDRENQAMSRLASAPQAPPPTDQFFHGPIDIAPGYLPPMGNTRPMRPELGNGSMFARPGLRDPSSDEFRQRYQDAPGPDARQRFIVR